MDEEFPTLPEGELEWEQVVDNLKSYLEKYDVKHPGNQFTQKLSTVLEHIAMLEGERIPNVRHSARQLYAYFKRVVEEISTYSELFNYIPFPRPEDKPRPELEGDVAELKREIDRLKKLNDRKTDLEKKSDEEENEIKTVRGDFRRMFARLEEEKKERLALENKYIRVTEQLGKEALIPIPKGSGDVEALTIANANYIHENKRLEDRVKEYEVKMIEMNAIQEELNEKNKKIQDLEDIITDNKKKIKELEKELEDEYGEEMKWSERMDTAIATELINSEEIKKKNIELEKRALFVESLELENNKLKKEKDELFESNASLMLILSELQKIYSISFSDDENIKMEKATKNLIHDFENLKSLAAKVRERLHAYDEAVVVDGGILGDYGLDGVSIYSKEAVAKMLHIVEKYNHLQLVNFDGKKFVYQGTIPTDHRGDIYVVDAQSVLDINLFLSSSPFSIQKETKSRLWGIDGYMLKHGQDQRNHSGVGCLELMFRDGEGRRMLHMIVSNISSETVDIGKDINKHISYKFINTIGRDVVSRIGSLSIQYKESGRIVSTKHFSYTVSMPPFSIEEESHYGVEMITDLSPDTKLYTTHISSGLVAVEMLTFSKH